MDPLYWSTLQIHTADPHCGSTTVDLHRWYSNSISIYVDPLYWSTLRIHTVDLHSWYSNSISIYEDPLFATTKAWPVILHSFIHDTGWILVPIVTVAPTVKAGFIYHCLKCRSNLLWIYIFFFHYMVKIFSLIIWIYMWICMQFHSSLDLRRSTVEGFKWIPSRVSHHEVQCSSNSLKYYPFKVFRKWK